MCLPLTASELFGHVGVCVPIGVSVWDFEAGRCKVGCGFSGK